MQHSGIVKRLVRDKGFGFVRDDHGTEYFFHRSAVAHTRGGFESLNENDPVTFEEEQSAKGPRATNIEPQ